MVPAVFAGFWAGAMTQAAAPPSWLWHGYLASGMVTLPTSLWKSGKTTLTTHLLARMENGGQLAGLRVCPGKIAYISEENLMLWKYRRERIPFGNNVYLLWRPFAGLPSHRGSVVQQGKGHREDPLRYQLAQSDGQG